ncbi:beta strand repeat-containing protein [Chryseobacterium mulctrae]|uniref:beta strand repeat-containing protein n=1 Tax=Chryseobacterium mulctrae TaxID=2576777 RepID=UPI001625F584|nr:DUF11 domain-containing protein [Chryseobacterium mulctrae]
MKKNLLLIILIFFTGLFYKAQDIAVNISGPKAITTGGSVTYKIYVTNNSTTNATNVTVKASNAANITETTISYANGPGNGGSSTNPSGGTVTLANLQGASGIVIPSLPSGSAGVFTVTGTASSTVANINYTATASSGGTDTNSANNSVTFVTNVYATASCGSTTTYTLNLAQTASNNSIAFNGGTINLYYTRTGGTAIAGLADPLIIPVSYSDSNSYSGTDHRWYSIVNETGGTGDGVNLGLATYDSNANAATQIADPGSIYNGLPASNIESSAIPYVGNGAIDGTITEALRLGTINQLGTFTLNFGNLTLPSGVRITSKNLIIQGRGSGNTNASTTAYVSGYYAKPIIQNAVLTGTGSVTSDTEMEFGQTYTWRYTAFATTGFPRQHNNRRGVVFKSGVITFTTAAAIPTITTTAATCSANGTATISNYNGTPSSYTFSPTGPTVAMGGVISNLTLGTTYTVTATVSGCQSNASAEFNIAAQLGSTTIPNFNDFESSAYRYFYDNTDNIASFGIKCGGGITADLTTLALRTAVSGSPIPATPLPVGTTLTWHSATPATDANQITDPLTAVTGATRKIYAAFRGGVNCYSPTREISIYAPICATDDDYTAIPITYGVGGTLPSVFTNDTYNNVIISTMPPSSVGFNYSIWIPANANISFSTGVITVPPTVLPGIYSYSYKIADKDPDGIVDSNASYASITFRVIADSDGDSIHDDADVDDDNDGIMDTAECSNTITDMANAYSGGTLLNIVPSDFGLALNVKHQNVTKDLSAKFGYPANSGAVIINITNASVHPITDAWWTKNGEQPSRWNVSGKMSAFVLMSQNPEFYSNDSKTIHIYDAQTVTPITLPGMVNQTAIAGQWSILDTSIQKTLNNLDNNTSTNEYGNWRYANMNFGAKSFGFSTTTAFGEPTYAVMMYLECDSDNDGIPNRLDLDSDADSCADAMEGDANITLSQLITATGTLSGGSTTVNQNICTTCVSTSGSNIGLPQFTTTPIGYSNTTGQSIGSSQNALVNGCICYEDPSLVTGVTYPVKHGITILGRAGKDHGNWPMIRNSAYTALESKTKGFVITRNSNPEGSITIPTVGMMVFDTDENSGKGCLKIYTGGGAGEGWKCFNTQGCP